MAPFSNGSVPTATFLFYLAASGLKATKKYTLFVSCMKMDNIPLLSGTVSGPTRNRVGLEHGGFINHDKSHDAGKVEGQIIKKLLISLDSVLVLFC